MQSDWEEEYDMRANIDEMARDLAAIRGLLEEIVGNKAGVALLDAKLGDPPPPTGRTLAHG